MRKLHKYSAEEIEYIKLQAAQGYSYEEIKNAFNKHFNTSLNYNQIKTTMNRYSIRNNVDAKFKKGMTSYNKGKKMSLETYEKLKHNMFKKGQKPSNTKPVGSERIAKYGYIEVKVAEPDKWKTKHVAIYEAHYGEVPKSHIVIFLDGNIRNFDIDNLALISRAENLYLNSNNMRFDNKDLTQAAVNVAKLNSKVKEIDK